MTHAPSAQRFLPALGIVLALSLMFSVVAPLVAANASASALSVASVSASADDGNVPANTVDADLATRWSAKGVGQHITYELSAPATVSSLQAAFYLGNKRSTTFDIQASTDGTTFTTVVAGATSNGTSTALETFTTPATEATHVRIIGKGNTANDWNSITEVQIHRIVQEPAVEEPIAAEPVVEEPVADSAGSVTRLGLHYTAEELAIWRERAVSGPYRVSGDVSTNSPGDWQRLVKAKDAFLANPGAGRYSPSFTGCIPRGTTHNPQNAGASNVRDAGFYALVQDDATVGRAVIGELLAQARTRNADYTNTSRFCPSEVDGTHPYFHIANFQTKLLYAFDYTKQWASDAEKAELRGWFRGAADYMHPNSKAVHDKLFANRAAGDYTPTRSPVYDKPGFYGGPLTSTYGRHYNNRTALIVRYNTLVGVDQNLTHLTDEGRRWSQEFVMFAVYADNWLAEFHRWTDGVNSTGTTTPAAPELGVEYSSKTLQQVITIADVLARSGDRSVYDFISSKGVYGTEGAPAGLPGKSLGYAIGVIAKHVDHSIVRYGTSLEENTRDSRYIIDFKNGSDWHSVNSVGMALANLYYQDPTIKALYERSGPGMAPYPANPASDGGQSPWAGDWGSLPAGLFMWGQMEGKVNPYPAQ